MWAVNVVQLAVVVCEWSLSVNFRQARLSLRHVQLVHSTDTLLTKHLASVCRCGLGRFRAGRRHYRRSNNYGFRPGDAGIVE